jgi:hypothetical protein
MELPFLSWSAQTLSCSALSGGRPAWLTTTLWRTPGLGPPVVRDGERPALLWTSRRVDNCPRPRSPPNSASLIRDSHGVFPTVLWGVIGVVAAVTAIGFLTRYAKEALNLDVHRSR